MCSDHGPSPCASGPYPADGNQPSPTANTVTSTMPTTNAGITEITVTNPVITRPTHVVRRSAPTGPSTNPTTTPSPRPSPPPDRLTPSPRPIRVEMSAPLTQLVPSRP